VVAVVDIAAGVAAGIGVANTEVVGFAFLPQAHIRCAGVKVQAQTHYHDFVSD
jgi:hypothetical protein